jgi:AcrR family transcriptional regulator
MPIKKNLEKKSPPALVKTDVGDNRSRDAERSRLAILKAGCDEFSQFGLGGARIDRIAERACLNKKLIYYYFMSKDELFSAVLESAYADIRAAEKRLNLANLAPADGLKRLTEFTWKYYIEHPEFITLLNSANLHQARHLVKSDRVLEMNSPLVHALRDILQRGSLEGVFRNEIDPVQLYISIAGLAYFYLSNNHTLSAIFGRNLMTAKARKERLSHMTDVILGYALKQS